MRKIWGIFVIKLWVCILLVAVVGGLAVWGWLRPSQKQVEKVVKETVVVQTTPVPVPATPRPTDEPTPTARPTVPTATATSVVSPTSAQGASSSISSTVNVTSTTTFVSGTVSNGLVHPEFFEGQSTGKEYRASYDVGVKPDQVGIAFGYAIHWQGRSLGFPTDECGLVVLLPGWYEKLSLTDGRYEVYDLPSSAQDFWIRDLARQRMEEQQNHYGCSEKKDIPVWDSDKPAIVWSIVAPPALTVTSTATTVTKATPTVALTTRPGTPSPTATPTMTTARVRVLSGKDGSVKFVRGDSVVGWKIVMDDGSKTCEGGCFLPSAPGPGTVFDGVVNPWPQEIPQGLKAWVPS